MIGYFTAEVLNDDRNGVFTRFVALRYFGIPSAGRNSKDCEKQQNE
jgi:hypothetical protein